MSSYTGGNLVFYKVSDGTVYSTLDTDLTSWSPLSIPTTLPIDAAQHFILAITIEITGGTASGSLFLEYKNTDNDQPGTWQVVDSPASAVRTISGATSVTWVLNPCFSRYFRVRYTRTSGTGSIVGNYLVKAPYTGF